VTQWEAISNQRFRFYANPATSYAEFQHDATDFLTTFTNTDKWTISGMTGGVEVDGFLSVQQPVNPFNPFHSDGKVFDSIRTNRFHGRQDQLFVSVDAVELTTTRTDHLGWLHVLRWSLPPVFVSR
jgi:hypothetical protein